MAISVIDNFTVNTTKNIDSRLGPYASVAEATGSISTLLRYVGMTVTVTGSGAPVEYWFSPTTASTDLVLKTAATSSYASSSISSSYALTASYAQNAQTASYTLNAISSSYTATASLAPLYLPLSGGTISGNLIINGTASISYLNVVYETASVILSTGSNQLGDAVDDIQTLYGSIVIPTGSLTITGSATATAGFTGSLRGTASWASNALTASYVLNAFSSSYAATASLAPNYVLTSATSSMSVATASYVLQSVSASFASTASYVTGSIHTSANPALSASYALTASYALNAGTTVSTASLLTTASVSNATITFTKGDATTFSIIVNNVASASYAATASYVQTAQTASYVTGSVHNSTNPALSASYALTASYAMNGGGASFPYTGSAAITGSLVVDGFVTATQGFTGSLFGTASWAINAQTASYANEASNIIVYVKNQSGANIAKGVVVRITNVSNNSDIPRITTASYENDNNSANTLGITKQAITNGNEGYVITEGILLGVDTSNFTAGQLIYLGATGSITGSAPVAPLHAVRLGEVIREQSNNGSIYVRIDNGYELDELHNVVIANQTSGDLLVASGSVWYNTKQLTGSYGLTGSLQATSFIGSLQGTSSWASNALTSSFALTASYVANASSFPYTGSAVITGSLAVTGSISSTVGFTGSLQGTASWATNVISASYAATSSITYITSSNLPLSEIEVADYSADVAVTFVNGRLKFIFGTPLSQSISSFTFNSTFATDRFNKVLDNYTASATWANNGYTLVAANIYEGGALLATTTTGTSLNYNTIASGSHTYVLHVTASSPLDNSLVVISSSLAGTLSKSNPGNPTLSTTPTAQLGASSNQIEQGATGSISFTSASGAANSWVLSYVGTNFNSPYLITGSATGSTSIAITATAYYSSSGVNGSDNSPALTTTTSTTTTYTKIRSLRYGASPSASYTSAELETLSLWDTTLGGSIGTISKGTTTASGQSVTISWTGDKYHYIVYNGSLSYLTNITAAGFSVINSFTSSSVGNYKVYRTTTLQAGGGGNSITYALT